jgi:hypothetical protein
MPFKRLIWWGLLLLLLATWGCKGEVPVAVEGKTGRTECPSGEGEAGDASELGFVALDFADFTPYLSAPEGDKPTWSVSDAGLIQTTGTPRGYLYTNKTFGDFTLRGEFRYIPQEESPDAAAMDKYNTVFLIYVPDDHKIWPRSLEVQGRYDQIGQVKKNARDININVTLDDQAAREQARKPIGEWNSIEIISQEGAVTAILNGTKISACEPGEPKSGRIGLQAEDYPVEFRRLRIRED